jgi:two-component system response regulator RegA
MPSVTASAPSAAHSGPVAPRLARGSWPTITGATPAVPIAAAAVCRRAVVLDEDTSSRRQLCSDLAAAGCEVAVVVDAAGLAAALTAGDEPDLVVAEYRQLGKSVADLLERVPPALWSRLVIVTAYGSVASAVRAVKLGVAGYLVKPARGAQVLHAAGYHAGAAVEDAGDAYLSLDRAIWEVLNEAVEQAGTVSGAARRLGLHARSLRRMLAKYPPAR